MSHSGEILEKKEKNLQADVVIIGMGPAGLTAAIDALREELHVILIEKRSEKNAFIRPQLVYLERNARNYLKDLPIDEAKNEDEKDATNEASFQQQLEDTAEHVSIKDIQRFFLRRIKQFSHVTFLFETEVNQVDLEKGFLTSQSKNKEKINIQFKHLIAADGAYHPDADSKIKNRTVDKLLKNTIEYEKLFESKLQHFVSSYFRVKRKNDGMMDPPSKFLDVYLTQYGHDYIYYHYSSLKKSNGKQLKFYVTSCIPKEQEQVFKEDKEAGIKHLMSIAHMIFSEKQYDISPVKASLKHGLTKDNLKYQIFSRVFYRAKMPGINQNGHYLLAIGDAALSPDFFQGIGTNAAILTGTLATNVILGTISLEGYNKILKERAKQQKTSSKEIEMKFKENWQKMTEEEFEEKTSPKVRDLQIQLEEKIDDVQLLKDRDRLFLKSKTTKSIYDDDLEILKIYLKVITDNKSNIKKIAAEWQKLQAALQNTGSDSRFFKKQISSGIKEFLKQIEGIALQHAKEYKEGDQNRRFRIL